MKIIVKYSVLFYSGDKGYVKESYICPDYEDMPHQLEIDGKVVHTSIETVLQQADEWVSGIDKSEMMDEKDIHMIFDWEIISAEKETQQLVVKEKKASKLQIIEAWLELSEMEEQRKLDFKAVYTDMYKRIKNMSVEKQISLTFGALGVAYDASGTAYQHMTDILSGKKENPAKQRLEQTKLSE